MNRADLFKLMAATAGVAALTTLIVGAGLLQWALNDQDVLAQLIVPTRQTVENIQTSSQNPTTTTVLSSSESVVVETVKKANPAVVAIIISKNVPVYERYYESMPGPFSDLFSFVIPRLRQNGTEMLEVGGGSGFFVSDDGYVVTNRHVVADDDAEYAVLTNAGETYSAAVVARDPALDLAILKVQGSNFPHLPFGDSDTLEVGQSVIAIGNALSEFRNTVSVGIVSGLARSIVASDLRGSIDALDQLIQTDAAINQGNSGGPLLNLQGEVIGINVAVASGAENIGFALSSNSIKSAVESVQKSGRIIRPYLGVRYIPITPDLQEELRLPVDHGLLIRGGGGDLESVAVVPDSPADKAGIVEGDIILEVNGEKFEDDSNLAAIIRSKNIGDTVTLRILHDGQEKHVKVTLEEMQ